MNSHLLHLPSDAPHSSAPSKATLPPPCPPHFAEDLGLPSPAPHLAFPCQGSASARGSWRSGLEEKAWTWRSREQPLQGGNLEGLSRDSSFPLTVHHPLVSLKSQQPQVDNSVLCAYLCTFRRPVGGKPVSCFVMPLLCHGMSCRTYCRTCSSLSPAAGASGSSQ